MDSLEQHLSFVAELDNGVNTLPGHTLCPLHHHLDIHHLGPVPVQFQDAPAPLNGIASRSKYLDRNFATKFASFSI